MNLNVKIKLPPAAAVITAGAATFGLFFLLLDAGGYLSGDIGALMTLIAIPATGVMWIANLFFNRRLGTHAARIMGGAAIFLVVAECFCLEVFQNAPPPPSGREFFAALSAVFITACGAILFLPGLWVFSMPSSLFSAIPLVLHIGLLLAILGSPYFAVVGFAFFMLSAYFFPKHRRLVEFWRPTRLPRIKARRT